MIERLQQNQALTQALAALSTSITFNSQQSMLDANRIMETILPTLFNNVYGLMLVDLNVIKHNHPAIDLGDGQKRIAIQITSDGSREKMVSTLDKFTTHKLDENYDSIEFFIISNDPKISFTRKGFNLKIRNFSDLAKDICALPQPHFESVYAFCKQQFKTFFSSSNVNIFAPVILPSVDPGITIDKFLEANQIDVNEEYITASADDIRNNLIALKNKLSELNSDQRWFIYQVIFGAMNHPLSCCDICAIPCSFIDSGKNAEGMQILRNTLGSLSVMQMAGFDEDSWRHDGANIYWVSHRCKQIEDFDYFSSIAVYLITSEQKGSLQKVIVDCDFSVIN